MSSLTPATEEVAEKRIGMTLLIHGILLLGSSAIPEEDFLIWFPINLVIEALIIIQLLRMWKRYKNKRATLLYDPSVLDADRVVVFCNDSDCENHVRYSLFLASTDFNGFLFFYAHFIREKIAEVFVNPKKKRQLHLWPVFLCILVFIGILIMAILRAESYHPNLGIAILLYLIGGMMTFVATPFSVQVNGWRN